MVRGYDFSWRPHLRGWFDFDTTYNQAIDEAEHGAIFVEIGTAFFRSALWLAEQAALAGKSPRIVCVDPWPNDERVFGAQWFADSMREGGAFNAGLRSLLEHGSRVEIERIEIVRATSERASRMFDDHEVDFVFIDGDHEQSAVAADIRAWFPKVKVGGIIAGHDYSSMFPGVIAAVEEAFGAEFELRVPVRGEVGTWVHRVRKVTT